MPKDVLAINVDSDLANRVRQKILDHRVATGKRITITSICVRALERFLEEPLDGSGVR